MPRYAHPDALDNGPAYIAANCDKVVITDIYTTAYATADGSAKVAEVALVPGDFSIAGADGAPRVLTAALAAKSAGNALKTVVDGTNMHYAFLDTVNSKVLMVTEESTDQPVTLGNPVTLSNNVPYTANQPTA